MGLIPRGLFQADGRAKGSMLQTQRLRTPRGRLGWVAARGAGFSPNGRAERLLGLWVWVVVASLTLGLGGCSWLRGGGPGAGEGPGGGKGRHEEPFELALFPEKSDLRAGAALIVQAKLRNISGDAVRARHLSHRSLSFWIWSSEDPDHVLTRSVHSAHEQEDYYAELEPGQVLSRDFVFTKACAEPGTWLIQAMYTAPKNGRNVGLMAVSPPERFVVQGPECLKRDEDGLIPQQEAIRLVKEHLGRPVTQEFATLVGNEAGLADWWVLVSVDPAALAQGERAEKGFYVNPYLGEIRKETRPDNHPARKKEDPSP